MMPKILWKVYHENVIMGTEFFNTIYGIERISERVFYTKNIYIYKKNIHFIEIKF